MKIYKKFTLSKYEDVEVDSFDDYLELLKFPIIVIFYAPLYEYHFKYVARLYDCNRETVFVNVKNKQEDIQIPEYMVKTMRHLSDHVSVICSYM